MKIELLFLCLFAQTQVQETPVSKPESVVGNPAADIIFKCSECLAEFKSIDGYTSADQALIHLKDKHPNKFKGIGQEGSVRTITDFFEVREE